MLMGVWLALTIHFCLREKILTTVNSLTDLSYKGNLTALCLYMSLIWTVLFTINIATYFVMEAKLVIDPLWASNILKKCGEKKLATAFYHIEPLTLGLIGLVLGNFFGLVYQHKVYQGRTRYTTPTVNPICNMVKRQLLL